MRLLIKEQMKNMEEQMFINDLKCRSLSTGEVAEQSESKERSSGGRGLC